MAAPASALLAAHAAGTLGVGMSGGGFTVSFVLGVLNMLYIELGVLKHDMPVAGGSAGAVCTAFASGLVSMPVMRHHSEHLASTCRANGNCYGTLDDTVFKELRAMLPPDSSERLNRHGRTYIAVSFPSANGNGPASLELVNRFNGTEDVLSTIQTSSYIPTWSAPAMVTKFRGRDAYDGSMAGGVESFLPCPPGVSYCVRISTMPANTNFPAAIARDVIGGGPEAYVKVASTLLETAAGANLPGYVGGLLHSVVSGGPDEPARVAGRYTEWVEGLMNLMTPGEGGADIWPGRRHPLPGSRLDWLTWMLAPADAETRQKMFEHGRAEALSWAQEHGFAAEGQRVAPPERLSSISLLPKRRRA